MPSADAAVAVSAEEDDVDRTDFSDPALSEDGELPLARFDADSRNADAAFAMLPIAQSRLRPRDRTLTLSRRGSYQMHPMEVRLRAIIRECTSLVGHLATPTASSHCPSQRYPLAASPTWWWPWPTAAARARCSICRTLWASCSTRVAPSSRIWAGLRRATARRWPPVSRAGCAGHWCRAVHAASTAPPCQACARPSPQVRVRPAPRPERAALVPLPDGARAGHAARRVHARRARSPPTTHPPTLSLLAGPRVTLLRVAPPCRRLLTTPTSRSRRFSTSSSTRRPNWCQRCPRRARACGWCSWD